MSEIRLNTFGKQYNNGASDWRDLALEIKDARDELKKHGGIMTTYEYTTIEKAIKQNADKYYSQIVKGALGEFNAKVQKYEAIGEKVKQARTKEIDRWQPDKMRDAMETQGMLIQNALGVKDHGMYQGDTPTAKARLQEILNEARDSGDLYKKRATFEIMRVMVDSAPDDIRKEVFHFARQAEKELNALRVTDELQTAKQEQSAMASELMLAANEMNAVSQILGEGEITGPFAVNDFAKAARRLKLNGDTLEVLPQDSPDVTGVDFSHLREFENE